VLNQHDMSFIMYDQHAKSSYLPNQKISSSKIKESLNEGKSKTLLLRIKAKLAWMA